MMQKPKILAADNTKVALRYMETILGDIYDVTLVQTGMSVLDCLKSEIPDLILMNANMFGMDGYEVLRRIKEDKETKEIPVILMMNVKDIQSELRGLEEGAIDFISLFCAIKTFFFRVNKRRSIGPCRRCPRFWRSIA